MKRLIIFDFDGTLVDTLTDVALCFNEALHRSGFPQHPLEAFSGFVGGNLETVVSRMLPPDQCVENNICRVKNIYRELYLASSKPNTKPYPGIMELLQQLKRQGYTLAINSNKGQLLLDDMVAKMFPPQFFDAVIGYQENFPSKPSPDGVYRICKICSLPLEQSIYVGDGASDIATAANAGIPCLFVLWGQGTENDRKDTRVYQYVRTTEDLQALLTKKE